MRRKWGKNDWIFAGACALIFLLQLWKAKQGIGSSDEHFYVTLGYRLYQGDSLFYDNWHIAQMISVFLWPFVTLYVQMTGGTAGIVLYMRIVYAGFTMLAGIALYLRFRRYQLAAVLAACAYMLFTPFNIMALSYNTMSVGFLILFLCIKPYSENAGYRKLRYLLAGVFYSASVLNTPYLALVYVIVIIQFIWFRRSLCDPPDRQASSFWMFTAGIMVSACSFLLFLFSRASLAEILSGLPHLIDPSHTGLLRTIIASGYHLLQYYWFLLVLLAAYCLYCRLRHPSSERALSAAGLLTVFALLFLCFFTNAGQRNIGSHALLLLPFSFLGLAAYLKTVSRNHQLFRNFYCISVFHALLVACSSNVGPRSFCCPLILASAVSILFLADYLNENPRPAVQYLLKCSTAVFLAVLAYSKAFNIYGGISSPLNTMAADGPCAGLMDAQDTVRDYEEVLQDAETVAAQTDGYVQYISDRCWLYLTGSKRTGTFSTYMYFWTAEEYEQADDQFLNEHADLRPLYLYLDSSNKYGISEQSAWMRQFRKVQSLRHGTLYVKD